MKTRLKILCWLFAAAYLFVIVYSVAFDFIPSFTSGFNEGMKDGYELAEKLKENDGKEKKHRRANAFGMLSVRVIPVEGYKTYPDKIINEKTGEKVMAENHRMYLKVEDMPQLPWFLVAGNILVVIISFVTLFCLVYVPVLSFKTIKSIVNDDIFDEKNIHRIRRIGYSLIVVFLCILIHAFVSEATAQHVMSMKDYKIVSAWNKGDVFILVFGIVVLIFAEVLKIATRIKEEQDLTV
ncbi:MAG: DUF2975 domain-containing protein [Dysgonamonadaceae bacterium]|jgi:hypothetical protein|nr:DUF2975 domain-containing protein [Dysgonamonadaceae bacterium]